MLSDMVFNSILTNLQECTEITIKSKLPTFIDPSYLTPIKQISFLNCESAKKRYSQSVCVPISIFFTYHLNPPWDGGEELSSDYPLISISTNLLLNNLCQSTITASAIDSQACSITLDCCQATVSSEIGLVPPF